MLLEIMVLLDQKAVVDQDFAAHYQTVTMSLFWCKFNFGQCFEFLSRCSH